MAKALSTDLRRRVVDASARAGSTASLTSIRPGSSSLTKPPALNQEIPRLFGRGQRTELPNLNRDFPRASDIKAAGERNLPWEVHLVPEQVVDEHRQAAAWGVILDLSIP